MGTYIIGAVVLAVIIFAGYKTYKGHKNGTSCGCGCSGCAENSSCHGGPQSGAR